MILRAASYNVHRGIGSDRRLDVGRCLEVIGGLDADLIGLQEVDAHRGAPAAGEALLEAAAELGYRSVHGMTLRRSDADYGNALLVRGHIGGIARHDLSLEGREPRGVLQAELQISGARLRAYVTHLGLRGPERAVQAARLVRLLAQERGPAVLLGDFNEWRPWARTLRLLRREFGPTPAPRTFPARLPLLALDRVWVLPRAGLRRMHAYRSALAQRASDHLPVIAEIEVPVSQ